MAKVKRTGVPGLGARIADILESRRMTLADLAGRAGVSPAYLGRVVRGQVDNPSVGFVAALAGALKVQINELMSDSAVTGYEQPRAVSAPQPQEAPDPMSSTSSALAVFPALDGRFVISQFLAEARNLVVQGRYREAITFSEQALALAEDHRPQKSRDLARIHLRMLWPYYAVSDFEQCKSHADSALELLWGEKSTARDESLANVFLSFVYYQLGDYRLALSLRDKSESLDPDWYEPYQIGGYTYTQLREFERARQCFERGAEIAERSNRQDNEAITQGCLGWFYLKTGDLTRAYDAITKSLSLLLSYTNTIFVSDNVRGVAFCYSDLAELYTVSRQWPEAEWYLGQARRLFEIVGDNFDAGRQCHAETIINTYRPAVPDASDLQLALDSGHKYLQACGHIVPHRAIGQRLLATIYRALGEEDTANMLALRSGEALRAIGNRLEMADPPLALSSGAGASVKTRRVRRVFPRQTKLTGLREN